MGAPTFELALQCCRGSFRDVRAAFVPSLPPEIEWDEFLRFVRFHRIQGIAWDALSTQDGWREDARLTLSDAAVQIAARNLQARAECQALRERFDAMNVPLLFLKGLTLGALAYRNPAVKAGIDIDLLVDPADLSAAAGILREFGYRQLVPKARPDGDGLTAWHRIWKESVWLKDDPTLQIDLHTRTADNPRVIPGIDVHSPRQSVDIGGGIELPTLADEELFAYLAVHGASSAWFRLKWISDFAGLIEGRRAKIRQLYERSQELGAGRAAGQALLLADALFDSLDREPELRKALSGDPQTRRLFRTALRLLSGAPIEPTSRHFGTAPLHWTQFLILPSLSFKMSELWRQAARMRMRGG